MKKLLCSLLGLIALTLSPGSAAVITYDSTVSDWYANGMTADGHNGLLNALLNTNITFTPPTNSILADADGSTSTFPTLGPGAHGGATWQAAAGEVVTQITLSGNFRSETVNQSDFIAAVYGGNDASTLSSLSSGLSFSYHAPTARASYSWTINIDPGDQISALRFDAWRTVGTVVTNGGGNVGGYSGSITDIQITTAAVPEPSTVCLLVAVGLVVLFRVSRTIQSKKAIL